MENGVPTYAYDLEEAVKDGYLVAYHSIETKLKLPTDGLHYDDLSEEEKRNILIANLKTIAVKKILMGSVFNSFVFQ